MRFTLFFFSLSLVQTPSSLSFLLRKIFLAFFFGRCFQRFFFSSLSKNKISVSHSIRLHLTEPNHHLHILRRFVALIVMDLDAEKYDSKPKISYQKLIIFILLMIAVSLFSVIFFLVIRSLFEYRSIGRRMIKNAN